jgi:hypothetical protein
MRTSLLLNGSSTLDRSIEPLRDTAIHEADHAVAHIRLNIDQERLSMKTLAEIWDATDVLMWFSEQMDDELPDSKERLLAQLLIQRVGIKLLIYGNATLKDNLTHSAALAAMLSKAKH